VRLRTGSANPRHRVRLRTGGTDVPRRQLRPGTDDSLPVVRVRGLVKVRCYACGWSKLVPAEQVKKVYKQHTAEHRRTAAKVAQRPQREAARRQRKEARKAGKAARRAERDRSARP